MIMNIKGKSMQTQEDFDKAYRYFSMQIQKHHNSDPFRVTGVGEAAKLNMDYLLSRARQELNVYFCKAKTSKEIVLKGKKKVIYTLLLKGKQQSTVPNYFKILCREGKVHDNNLGLLNETLQTFNILYNQMPAKIESRITKKGELSYTLSTFDGQRIPELEYKLMSKKVPKPQLQHISIPIHYKEQK